MASSIEIVISTSSQLTPTGTENIPPANIPSVLVDGVSIKPDTAPSGSVGYNLIILDTTQAIPSTASILLNTYIQAYCSSGFSEYEQVYETIVRDLLSYDNSSDQVIILTSFNWDRNMPPTNDALVQFFDYGAGSQLQDWVTHCDPGSGGMHGFWISYPVNYILVGFSGSGSGSGLELYQAATGDSTSISSTLSLDLDLSSKSIKASNA